MALVVEDGTGKADATTFASVADFKAFAQARGVTPPDNSKCEVFLTLAWDAMRDLQYKGSRYSKTQAGPFPRTDVVIDGFCFDADDIPPVVTQGQCALAMEAMKTDLLPTITANVTGALIERTVGPITKRWADSGRTNTRPLIQKAKVFLSDVLAGTSNNIPLRRA